MKFNELVESTLTEKKVIEINDYEKILIQGLQAGIKALGKELMNEVSKGIYENSRPESIAKQANMLSYIIEKLKNADDRTKRAIMWDMVKEAIGGGNWILDKDSYKGNVQLAAKKFADAKYLDKLSIRWNNVGTGMSI